MYLHDVYTVYYFVSANMCVYHLRPKSSIRLTVLEVFPFTGLVTIEIVHFPLSFSLTLPMRIPHFFLLDAGASINRLLKCFQAFIILTIYPAVSLTANSSIINWQGSGHLECCSPWSSWRSGKIYLEILSLNIKFLPDCTLFYRVGFSDLKSHVA